MVRDLCERYFIAIQSTNNDLKPIWIAKALFDPFSNPNHPNCVLIQYFQPMS